MKALRILDSLLWGKAEKSIGKQTVHRIKGVSDKLLK